MRTAIIALVIFVLGSNAAAQLLYDGSAATAPEAQPWLAYYSIPGFGAEETAGGKTTYDSTAALVEHGGFSNYTLAQALKNASFPALDRVAGYTVSFDAKLLSESHSSNDRAGLSIIALSSDLKGIELGFWTNEIWAQSGSDFLHSEGATYDPTAANTTYDLVISGLTYSLKVGNSEVLGGSLRDYSAAGLVYTLPSFLFVGDDTGSAQGKFELSRLAVVPEPASGAMLAALCALLVLPSRRRPIGRG